MPWTEASTTQPWPHTSCSWWSVSFFCFSWLSSDPFIGLICWSIISLTKANKLEISKLKIYAIVDGNNHSIAHYDHNHGVCIIVLLLCIILAGTFRWMLNYFESQSLASTPSTLALNKVCKMGHSSSNNSKSTNTMQYCNLGGMLH